jgi:hypothetical protein
MRDAFHSFNSEPMIRRINLIDSNIPICFLHGQRSWIDREPSSIIQSKRANVAVDIIPDAGHHVSKNTMTTYVFMCYISVLFILSFTAICIMSFILGLC